MAQYSIWDTCDVLITFLRAGMTVTGWNVQLGDLVGLEADRVILVYPTEDDEAADGIGAVNYVETQTIQVLCALKHEDTRANIDSLRDVMEDVKGIIRADANGRHLGVPLNIEGVSIRAVWRHESIQQQGFRTAALVLTCIVASGA